MSISKTLARLFALLLVLLLVVNGTTAMAFAETSSERRHVADNKYTSAANSGHRKRRPSAAELMKPTVTPVSFSQNPSDQEIENARVFLEPLIPMDSKVTPVENQALAKALLEYKRKNNPEELTDLTGFIKTYPQSRWRAALEINLAELRFESGYLTDSLNDWASAWQISKGQTEPARKAIADNAISHLVKVEARLGLMSDLKAHLAEIKNRPLYGSSERLVKDARDGLYVMQNHKEVGFKCGPYAVDTLAHLMKKGQPPGCLDVIRKAASTWRGTNMAQVEDWAKQIGLNLQTVKRTAAVPIIVPSVMHWKVGHFGAITGYEKGRYHIEDPTFDTQGSFWVSQQALDSQTDGYFLVPACALPAGWSKISRHEAASVWGKGSAMNIDGTMTPDSCHVVFGAKPCCGMPVASAFSLNATLSLSDSPLFYEPPVGPGMSIVTTYVYGEGNQISSPQFTNFGADWNLNWLSFLTVDISGNVTVRVRGGGYEVYNYPYANIPNLTSQALMVRTGTNTYQRQLPDGSVENFTLTAGGAGVPIFMTSVVDPHGNAATISFDANDRITGISDAAGNAPSTFTYASTSSGNPGFYKPATITDPFGRTAQFTYDSSNTYLTAITDAVGNVSQFLCDPNSSFISMLTTPYGSTSFYQYVPTGTYTYPPTGLRVTFPDGTASVIENWLGDPRQTYYWDREATALYRDDPANQVYSHCTTTRWLLGGSGSTAMPLPVYIRPPLEAPMVFNYLGSNQLSGGTCNKPQQVVRQLSGMRETGTVTGTITPGNQLFITISDLLLPGENIQINYTVQAGDTLASIAAAFAAGINAQSSLQAFGITATASSSGFTFTSLSPNAISCSFGHVGTVTESITFAAGPNPPEQVRLFGNVTPGDTLTLTMHDSGLSGGVRSVSCLS